MSRAPTILAAACTFPAGPSLALADAAVRASLSLQQYHPDYFDTAGERTRISAFPLAAPFDSDRWWLLAEAVLAQLNTALAEQPAPTRRQLWLVLPETRGRPGLPANLQTHLQARLEGSTGPWQHIEVVTGGHAAGVQALMQASEAVQRDPATLAIVLAVEAGLSKEALFWLDMQGLLHGASQPWKGRTRANPYGRIPGEGAAAIALGGHAPNTQGWASLLGCATAMEPNTHRHSQPCTGKGLYLAARQALTQAGQHRPAKVDTITADLNGEPYRADQFGFTALRLGEHLAEDWQRSTPALSSGDLGCATAVVHVALAAYAQWQRSSQAHHLVLASSDDSLRGAAIVGTLQPISLQPEVRPWRSPSTSTA